MEVMEGRSSSNDLSSAPPSDEESTPGPLSHLTTANHGARDSNSAGTFGVASFAGAGAGAGASATGAAGGALRQDNRDATVTVTSLTTGNTLQPPPKRVYKPRKKKDPNAPPGPEKEKKERVTNRRARGASSTTSVPRKKPKLEATDANSTIDIPGPQSASLQSSTLVQPVAFSSRSPVEFRPNEAARPTETGAPVHEPSTRSQMPSQQSYSYSSSFQSAVQTPAPRSTGMYDPIRSVTRPVEGPQPSSASLRPAHTPPRPIYNPSTSPAISGIIDHPTAQSFKSSSISISHQPKVEPSYGQPNGRPTLSPPMAGNPTPMDLDSATLEPVPSKKVVAASKKVASEAPTRATSPKPARAKEQPHPLPPGSGLLSASLFGGDSSNGGSQKDSGKGPNIVLHIDLKDPNNRVINFARMAEEKYGFAALYPRQAAQKERLAKVAAAGAALERSASGSKFGGTSGGDSGDDDLSVDIERDSDNDGDIAMSGVNGGQEAANSGTDGPGPKRRRRRKVEEYNQDDPFIDDSELLWEAQAAASKDGFFVYCGPLVPEGEKPAVERADGTIKRGRGRGRGGGPGSRGGRAGAAAAAAEGGSGRSGGPGSRGGGVTRKPRMTKSDRAQLEKEKLQREKMAPLVARPAAYPG
ncbi:hypothetical protein A1O1_00702 [Capronia coronata CBS 617.96]|uniref:Hpc2-related domain-containing protein n=1 Tax=Capronia coronata CBS 617.96 TaxID=1182541 RepID=W9Z0V7_9EURO|nr:uncharacterized protein A1O1_00702 [Capronia coronata CBS 617.96]EXJ95580.1 hypothetical protein A1O1_00702 [Capronia coronata CBS 617.96]